MTRGVTRGLLGVARRGVLAPKMGSEQRTANQMAMVEKAPIGDYRWRELAQTMRRYAAGHPDLYGRRVFSSEVKAKAKYVARVANKAYLTPSESVRTDGRVVRRVPALPKSWTRLRNALMAVYKELEEGYR